MMVKVEGRGNDNLKIVGYASKTFPGDGVLKTSETHPVAIVLDKKAKKLLIVRLEEIIEADI